VSLAQILYPPPTDRGFQEWATAHDRQHEAIAQAIKETKGIVVEYLPLYPVNENDLDNWLRQHQQMHNEMLAALGIPGTDLSVLDLKDKPQADSWFFTHYLQHQQVAQACGQPV
jgi:hypothetical protein